MEIKARWICHVEIVVWNQNPDHPRIVNVSRETTWDKRLDDLQGQPLRISFTIDIHRHWESCRALSQAFSLCLPCHDSQWAQHSSLACSGQTFLLLKKRGNIPAWDGWWGMMTYHEWIMTYPGWWFQPLVKNISQLGWLSHIYPYIMENKKWLKPPTSIKISSKVYNNTHRCKTRSVQRSTPQHCQKPKNNLSWWTQIQNHPM